MKFALNESNVATLGICERSYAVSDTPLGVESRLARLFATVL